MCNIDVSNVISLLVTLLYLQLIMLRYSLYKLVLNMQKGFMYYFTLCIWLKFVIHRIYLDHLGFLHDIICNKSAP